MVAPTDQMIAADARALTETHWVMQISGDGHIVRWLWRTVTYKPFEDSAAATTN